MGLANLDRWWTVALRGVAAILLGIAAFAWPGLTLVALVLLIGAYVLVDGVFSLVGGVMSRSWLLVLEGVAGIVFGLLTLFWPGITAVVLLFLVAAWAIVTGIAELVAAIRLRGVIRNEWFLVLTAVASLIFGILLVINPGAGLLALVWLVGAYALVFGVLMLLLAYRLRSRRETGSAVGAAG